MRIREQLIILFAISSLAASGQNKIQGYILDKQTNKPLSYAIVAEIHQKYGSYSDTTGLFTILYANSTDSIKVSNLGYNSINIRIQDLQKSEKILLEANPHPLGEVKVNPKGKKTKELELGFFTKKTNIVTALVYPMNLIAVFIPFPKDGNIFLIKSIKFIYEQTGDGSPLRVRIHNADSNGEPGEALIAENVIFKNKNHKLHVANIDVSKANIYMPRNGVFIVFEWIMDKSLAMTDQKKGIPGPYIGGKKSNNETPLWIISYNDTKWIKTQTRSTLSAGLRVVDYSK